MKKILLFLMLMGLLTTSAKAMDMSNTNIPIETTGAIKGSNTYRYFTVRLLDADTSHTTDTTVGGDYRIPVAITVEDVGMYFDTAGTTSVTTIDINEAGTSILSTKLTVDATEKTSETAATPAVISDTAIASDAIITFDIDGIASGTAAKGLVVWIKFRI